MNFFNSFAEKHPKAVEWFRKGGLFLIFSWVVTALKAVMLMFLPDLFRSIVGNSEWLWKRNLPDGSPPRAIPEWPESDIR